jgi:ParB-like nuclease domain
MTTALVTALGNDLELWRVDIDDAREQDVNARAMPPAMFERLQATIARDGRLESLPLLAQTDKGLEVISGHHRLRATRAAGVPELYALVDVSGLSRSQIAAKQLAHNSISGTDDDTLLAQIFASIDDVDAKLEAFINPDDLKLPEVDQTRLPRIDLDFEFRTVLFTFLPRQHERFTHAVEQLEAQTPLEHDELMLIDRELFEWWQACMSRTRREYDARSLTTVVSKIVDTVLAHYDIDTTNPADVDPEAWVPLSDIFGSALVPPDVADVLRLAVEDATDAGLHTRKKPWALLEKLANDYLGTPAAAP